MRRTRHRGWVDELKGTCVFLVVTWLLRKFSISYKILQFLFFSMSWEKSILYVFSYL